LSDAHAALATVGLDPHVFGSRDPWGLSGGEARRAALAGVLAMRPRYLLLDEPTAGLDAAGRAAVLAAVAEARRGAGVLVVTHDPEEFLADADVVVVLLDGRTAYAGNVAGLLEALPALDAAGVAEPGEVVRAQLLAEARGVRLDGPIALDPVAAAGRLARAAGER
jgi:energy-coupling factor transport system ATP-binding protein